MLSIYFVRHGQTEYSKRNAFCGSIDPPLTDEGRAMAEAVAARYGGEKWAAIYASPRLRTQQTAEPTAKRAGMKIFVEEGLREIDYGSWEGRPEKEVEASEPDAFHAWSSHPGLAAPPGGENAHEIAGRAMKALKAIRERHSDGKILVFSHKATLRIIACSLLGIDVDLFRSRVAQPVASITAFEFKKSGPLLIKLGDVSHLPPELASLDGT
jgi:probable phosphoglycerate mutase